MRRFRLVLLAAIIIYSFVPMSVEALVADPDHAKTLLTEAHKPAAIVIDDFGSNMLGTKEMFELPIVFTAAIIPFQPTTKRDAEWAHRTGNEVIVHLPMEAKGGGRRWLGKNAITSDLSDEEVRKRVNEAIDDVPFAVGLNNHMGSKVTGDERIMKIVLQVCRERGLYFLDSKTNYFSVSKKIAEQVGVRYVENRIFLDDVQSINRITKQMRKIGVYLEDHNECVAIGHVGLRGGKKTAGVIRDEANAMKSKIDFVPASQLTQIPVKGS
ncbi:MAG: sugar deacetylase [Paenibacillaceae bacterium]|jgi:polysaccharide deacetylase 2 family uncharacterized protein YibQ|nr:sugar deacetylase [Paenibacillaceae bacterium]